MLNNIKNIIFIILSIVILLLTISHIFWIWKFFSYDIRISNLFQILTLFHFLNVITSSQPILALLNLIAGFVWLSILLLFYKLQFFSLAFIIIYIGAVSVLFWFTIMLFNRTTDQLSSTFINFNTIFGISIFIHLKCVFPTNYLVLFDENNVVKNTDLQELAENLYVDHFFFVVIITWILLCTLHSSFSLAQFQKYKKYVNYRVWSK